MQVGIGTTGLCNMKCPHCYSRKYDGHCITYDDVLRVLKAFDISSVNFGTGENILNPDFRAIVALLHEKKIKMSLTTNGFTVSELEDDYLKMFNDIDFSLEFPDRSLQDRYRCDGSWDSVIHGIEKCKKLDIPVSIACALMKKNAKHVQGFRQILLDYNCYLRINIIKCGSYMGNNMDKYELGYDEFWDTFRRLFNDFVLISCSEPVLCVALDSYKDLAGSPCGQDALRIQPDGSILPCVYWPSADVSILDSVTVEDVMKRKSFQTVGAIPAFCQEIQCSYLPYCKGGCASRRVLSSGIDTPDMYCPLWRGQSFPTLQHTKAHTKKDLVHSSYLCTVILGGAC